VRTAGAREVRHDCVWQRGTGAGIAVRSAGAEHLQSWNGWGNIAIFRQLNEAPSNNDPATTADAGNGFLLRNGFTLVWSAWASDVATTPGDNRLVLRPPIATKDGMAITGKVAYELIVDAPRATARLTGNLGTAYPVASGGRLMRC
jgi:hypothetical protein